QDREGAITRARFCHLPHDAFPASDHRRSVAQPDAYSLSMKIERHIIDVEHAHQVFNRNRRDFPVFLENARTSADPSGTLIGIALSYVSSGAVVAPDSPEVALALRVAAQSHTVMIMFAEIHDPPRYIHLGEGPPVTYTVPAHESYVHTVEWYYAFML